MCKIDKEFQALIPPLSAEEFEQLEQNVTRDGCRDAICVWGEEKIIIDGHNRYTICGKHNIPYEKKFLYFKDRTEAKVWIINNQFGRRNLSAYTRAKLALELKPLLAEQAKQAGYANRGSSQNSVKMDTQKTLAKIANTSHDTIHKVEKIEAKASPETKRQLEAGEISVNEAYQKLNTHVSHNSGIEEWYTPPEYIEAARQVLGVIDLDPASSPKAQETVRATRYYTAADDGLSKSWTGKVWLNPPYTSGVIDKFIAKVVECEEAVVLVNNATDTKWFQQLAAKAAAICFPSGRIRFLSPNGKQGSPLQGQAVVYLGHNLAAFSTAFRQFGFVVEVANG